MTCPDDDCARHRTLSGIYRRRLMLKAGASSSVMLLATGAGAAGVAVLNPSLWQSFVSLVFTVLPFLALLLGGGGNDGTRPRYYSPHNYINAMVVPFVTPGGQATRTVVFQHPNPAYWLDEKRKTTWTVRMWSTAEIDVVGDDAAMVREFWSRTHPELCQRQNGFVDTTFEPGYTGSITFYHPPIFTMTITEVGTDINRTSGTFAISEASPSWEFSSDGIVPLSPSAWMLKITPRGTETIGRVPQATVDFWRERVKTMPPCPASLKVSR